MIPVVRAARRTISGALLGLCLCSGAIAQDSPDAYAEMGTPLWKELASRLTSNLKPGMVPYFVFVDGKNITVAPQAYVANFNVPASYPIQRVLPGAKTVAETSKYRVVSLSEFLKINAKSVNMVTAKKPVRGGVLNVYSTAGGNPTTVEYMAR